ncbi:MAG: serine/threonine protein kinase [Planctomycetia bacterium]|nr:serine/threonine protein kinase [Planctomycetia bacterium]
MMQPHPRYQVLDQIAVGDFATVYRGKDLELNRDVAIKQIHPQFLADQRQLERYWQEAQLLASLEHPNILTIYDIARDRGWLILELMQGSLWDRAAGQPMDLNFLRVALACSLQALKFLHDSGIVHGDVKPSNLLLDKRNWVKLGDFGLAQRVTNDQGSLLKGTTKYMAPERVSDQFGAVGPHSDLYSLGFSMYELMCGSGFETLFPGLGAFGRDQQIAWMMWQAAPDRQLPDIRRVLAGVPDDLVHVLQRLVIKDPRRRYQSADEALRDLKSGISQGTPQPTAEEQAAQAAAAQEAVERKKKRRLLIAASAVSLLICGGMFAKDIKEWLYPPPPAVVQAKDFNGVIASMHPEQKKVVLDSREAVKFGPEDVVFLNDRSARFADLEIGDRLAVAAHRDRNGKPFQEIRASRSQQAEGRVKSVQPRDRKLVVTIGEGPNAREVSLTVPEKVPILFNGEERYQDRKLTLADLSPNDRVVISDEPGEKDRVARSVSISRVVPLDGIVHGMDPKKNTLTIALGTSSNAKVVTWPLAANCEVTINRRKFIDGRPFSLTDLRAGDEVSLKHDTEIVSLSAARVTTSAGTLKDVAADGRTLRVQVDGETEPKTFTVDAETHFLLGGEPATPTDLQPGDAVSVRFDAADPTHPVALQVSATRDIDRTRWAVLIAEQDFRDNRLNKLSHPRADVTRLQDVLVKRYRMAADQVIVIADADRATLEANLAAALQKVGSDAHLLVYVAGHAYVDPSGIAYFAASDFQLTEMKNTGLPLTGLFSIIDGCKATDKLLILDTCQPGGDADAKLEPSTEEIVAVARKNSEQPVQISTVVIASCQQGQRGVVGPGGHGVLADALVDAFTGRADADGDRRVTTEELFQFVNNALRTATNGSQAPVVIQPQRVIPPRLSEGARQAINRMGAMALQEHVNTAAMKKLYQEAEKLAPGQPEPRLIYGLALLKERQFNDAQSELQAVHQAHSDQPLAVEGIVWCLFQKRQYAAGINGLTLLVTRMPRDKAGAVQIDRASETALDWAGRLREFADTAVAAEQRPPDATLGKLDQAVGAAGEAAGAIFRRGRQSVTSVVADFEKKIAQAPDEADRLKLNLDRRRLSHYADFPLEISVQQILDGTKK